MFMQFPVKKFEKTGEVLYTIAKTGEVRRFDKRSHFVSVKILNSYPVSIFTEKRMVKT